MPQKVEGMIYINTYAYIRVSSIDQREDRQLDSIIALKVPAANIFIEKHSGKDFNRPVYQALMEKLKPGDLLYIKSIDRLGRNYYEILDQWDMLTKKSGVDIVVLDMLPLLDTRKGKDLMGIFLSDIVLAILSLVAQKERENIRQRQAEGIAAAKARNIHLGRPVKKAPANFSAIVENWERGEITFKEALVQTSLKRATFYNRLKELRSRGGNNIV